MKYKKIKNTLILFFFGIIIFLTSVVIAQNNPKYTKDLIQFSGIVVNGSKLTPISYTSIMISSSYRGTISDNNGFFSLVAKKGDTIFFSAIGFVFSKFVIPDTLKTNHYSLIQVLERDTVELDHIDIYPWPSKEEFKEAFLNLNFYDNSLEESFEKMNIQKESKNINSMARINSDIAYKYGMQQQQSKLYYAGQFPINNLLNPAAWVKFIKSWKNRRKP